MKHYSTSSLFHERINEINGKPQTNPQEGVKKWIIKNEDKVEIPWWSSGLGFMLSPWGTQEI